MADLRHTVTHGDESTLLSFEGEIDISNSRAMRTILMQAVASTKQRLDLNLQAVSSMDSSAIATLIEAHAKAEDSGKSFRVTATSERVSMALKLLCLDSLLMGDS